ncbi:polysaccharide biosynthesis/export family protein [Erythrobacter sp. R86502]|uniref:polysaccharide biosynthesis/export family protein n=1 Tax=Erythrobacter sp. R86502 TaxID=3093846 RepID=UPI0036D3B69E
MIAIRKPTTILMAFAILVNATACSSGLANLPPLTSTGVAEIQVAPGDKIRIAVQDLPAVNGDYAVDETGSISVPLIKQVKVAGLSYARIEEALTRRLIDQDILKNPVVTVQGLDLRPVYIIGEVRQPGELVYRQGLTVFAAVSMAGGYTYRAKTGSVAITRTIDGREVTSVAAEDAVLLPGDRIRVYESWF